MIITRRHFLAAATATFLGRNAANAIGRDNIVAGAIRWDAWYERTGASVFAQNSLAPQKFQHRAPIHCRAGPLAEAIKCEGDDAVMAAEIEAAAGAGLDYWAFVLYSEKDPNVSSLRSAWTLYQRNSMRDQVKWCMIASISNFGSYPPSFSKSLDAVQPLFDFVAQKHYQRIGADRPLIYILWSDDDLKKYFNGSLDSFSAVLRYVRSESVRRGTGDPYFVIMAGAPQHSAAIARSSGSDAISNYISAFSKRNRGSFIELESQVEAFWVKLASTMMPIVPIVMVGWDTRPRQEHPVPWQRHNPTIDPNLQQYYADATPTEFAGHVRKALQFTKSNPSICPAKTILIYSWDECDEGGGILPTLGDPSGEYLKALKVLK